MDASEKNLVLVTSIIFGLIITFFAFIAFDEWYKVSVQASHDELTEYNFGTIETMRERGWHFTSATKYAQMNLLQGFSLVAVMLVAFLAAFKRNLYLLLLTALLFAGLFFFWKWFLGQPEYPL